MRICFIREGEDNYYAVTEKELRAKTDSGVVRLLNAKDTAEGYKPVEADNPLLIQKAVRFADSLGIGVYRNGLQYTTAYGGAACVGLTGDTPSCIEIEVGTQRIEPQAFTTLDITDISLPNTLIKISKQAFSNCPNLKSVKMPDSILEIGIQAFKGCKSLERVQLGNHLTYIDVSAFSGCKNLSGKVTIPESVEVIDDKAFADDTNIEELILPENIFCIGQEAFYRCFNLHTIKMPKHCDTIETFAFSHCHSLKRVELPDIDQIPMYCFDGCEQLEFVHIPDSVRSIGANAFRNCPHLHRVQLPRHLTFLGADVFECFEPVYVELLVPKSIDHPHVLMALRNLESCGVKLIWID